MSAQTPMYIYNQRQQVVLLEPGASVATRRYVKVYSKDLTVIKGVDNELQFQMLNQDQKPVNIDGKDITARIISYDGQTTLLQKSLIPVYSLTGITSLHLTAEELSSIDTQRAFYSLEIPGGSMYVKSILLTSTGSGYTTAPTVSIVDGGGTGATATATITDGQVTDIEITNPGKGYTSGPRVVFSSPPTGGTKATATVSMTGAEYAIFVDAQGGGRGVLNIVNSTLPEFVPAHKITIPSHPWPTGQNGNVVKYWSSVYNTKESASFTAQTHFVNFTGSTTIQGSIVPDFSISYQITEPESFTDFSGITGESVIGHHPFVRIQIENSGTLNALPTGGNIANLTGNIYYGGDVTNILFR